MGKLGQCVYVCLGLEETGAICLLWLVTGQREHSACRDLETAEVALSLEPSVSSETIVLPEGLWPCVFCCLMQPGMASLSQLNRSQSMGRDPFGVTYQIIL